MEKALKSVIVFGLFTLLVVIASTLAGCGSNIPIDPECEALAGEVCRTRCFQRPWGPECHTICEETFS